MKKIFNNSITRHFGSSLKRKIADELTNYIVSNLISATIKMTTMSLNISQYSMEYHNFIKWFNEHHGNSVGRDSFLTGQESPQFFMYKKHIFILTHITDQDTKAKTISIKLVGKNKQIMSDLYDEFKFKPSKNITIYNISPTSGWNYICEVPQRNLDTVVLNEDLKSSILTRISEWQNSRKWYTERGLAYKLGLVFYGPPGTGKTSFIKALASHIGYDLYLMNLNTQSDTTLVRNLSSTGRKSIIVMEDFDSSPATQARSESLQAVKDSTDKIETKQTDDLGVTTSGLLNALDGLIPLNDRIIIMTTNLIENVDSALVRKGRIDGTYYFGLLGDTEIKKYIKVMFPDYNLNSEISFADITGCDLQDLYMQNKYDFYNFVSSIPKINPN